MPKSLYIGKAPPSLMSFQEFGLHESLLSRLAEIGFENPTPIQREAIPLVMLGRDLLGSAQTGTGKHPIADQPADRGARGKHGNTAIEADTGHQFVM